MPPPADVLDLARLAFSPEEAAGRARIVYDALVERPGRFREPNFRAIGVDDLQRLFACYDAAFFGGRLGPAVVRLTGRPLAFRLSPTMTRAGGKTYTYRNRATGETLYEIAVASRLLFMNFGRSSRPVSVCGLECANRLHALQLIMEHEIIHLLEILAYGRSSCARPRFQAMARNIFGHTQSTHDLVTPPEHAAAVHNVRPGVHVTFEIDGVRHAGVVNRIHHRATVLVLSPDGQRYADGRRYLKFYVPLDLLEPAEAS